MRLLLVLLSLTLSQAAVIGIDLGSEFFKVSLIRPGKKLIIVENQQSKRMTSTALGMNDESRVFGDDAAQLHLKNPERVLTYLTRVIGVPSENAEILSRFQKEFIPIELFHSENQLNFSAKLRDTTLNVDEGIGMILEFVKRLSEKAAEGTIRDCVITIPVYWTRAQRKALMSAAEAAKLNVLALIHENTAAAFYYGIDRFDNETDHYALFYNIGASDLEVSLAKYNVAIKKTGKKTSKSLENVEVLAHAWDEGVGGRTFDALLAEELMDRFKEQFGEDPRENSRTVAKFVKEANIAKKILSASKNTPLVMTNAHKGKDFSIVVERDWVEAIVRKFADRLSEPVQRVLDQAGVEIGRVDNVEIVGGVPRIPVVQEIIKERFGKEASMHLNGDEAMAHGAAIFAANFTSDTQVRPLWLSDTLPFEYTATFTSPQDPSFKKSSIIFKKGAFLNSQKKVGFSFDKDVTVILKADYGKGPVDIVEYQITEIAAMAQRNSNKTPSVIFVFDLDFNGVPTLREATGSLEVEFIEKHYYSDTQKKDKDKNKDEDEEQKNEIITEINDANVEVQYEIKQKGKKAHDVFRIVTTQLEVPRPLSYTEIKKLKDSLEEFNKQDEDRKRLNEAKNELESMIYNVKDKLSEESFEKVTTEKERDNISALITDLQDWLDSGEFKNAKSAMIYEKKKQVQDKVKDALSREEEFNNRGYEVEQAFKTLDNLYDQMLKLNITKTWIDQPEKDVVFTKIEETKKWLTEMVEKQEEVPATEAPVLKIAQIKSKVGVAERKVENIKKIGRGQSGEKKQKNKIPDFIKMGGGNMGNIKMDNVVINGETYNYDPEVDGPLEDEPEEIEDHRSEL